VPIGELLVAEGVRFGRRATVIVITPSTDLVWVSALRSFLERGVRSLALLLDGSTFGNAPGPNETLAALASAGVRGFVYRRGDTLADVFLSADNVASAPAGTRASGGGVR
jgi:hypothetical protein